MAKKPKFDDSPRQCVTCGKTLARGIRWCVSCGTHDQADLDARVADVDVQVEKRRERNYMMMLLTRLSFGLWRF